MCFSADCISTAQFTASSELANSTRKPSPILSTSLPLYFASLLADQGPEGQAGGLSILSQAHIVGRFPAGLGSDGRQIQRKCSLAENLQADLDVF